MKARFPIPAVCGALVVIAALTAVATRFREHGTVSTPAPSSFNGHFTLETTDGRTVTESTYRGKWLLIYFGFTICPDACPTSLLAIGSALEALGPRAAQLQPLFITIDPERDTPQVMARYLNSFDPHIVGLVGTPEQIEAAEKGYRVYDASRPVGGGTVAIDHSSFIYLVDPRGAVAQVLTGDLPGHTLAEDLRRLLP